MLTATRVISRKALECSGITSEIYTHRNFSTILKNVSNIILRFSKKKMEYRLSGTHKLSIITVKSLVLSRTCLQSLLYEFGFAPGSTCLFDYISFVVLIFSRPQPPQYPSTNVMECSIETSELY